MIQSMVYMISESDYQKAKREGVNSIIGPHKKIRNAKVKAVGNVYVLSYDKEVSANDND